jgi:hypothetical protein
MIGLSERMESESTNITVSHVEAHKYLIPSSFVVAFYSTQKKPLVRLDKPCFATCVRTASFHSPECCLGAGAFVF